MQTVRYAGVAILTAAVVLFAVQNLQPPVAVQFLAWEFRANVTLLTLVPFLAGLLVGSVGALVARRARRRRAAEPETPPQGLEAPETGPADVEPPRTPRDPWKP